MTTKITKTGFLGYYRMFNELGPLYETREGYATAASEHMLDAEHAKLRKRHRLSRKKITAISPRYLELLRAYGAPEG